MKTNRKSMRGVNARGACVLITLNDFELGAICVSVRQMSISHNNRIAILTGTIHDFTLSLESIFHTLMTLTALVLVGSLPLPVWFLWTVNII